MLARAPPRHGRGRRRRDRQAGAESHYTLEDFPHVEKIDAHVHVHGVAGRFMAQAIADNFRILTINVDYPDFPPIAEQLRDAISLRQRYPGRVAFATTFSVADFGSPGWTQAGHPGHRCRTSRRVRSGVKIWKNIGMTLRDADGHYVMPDDARFEPVIAHLERVTTSCCSGTRPNRSTAGCPWSR